MDVGFYFALLLIRAGEPVGPAQLYELKIQLVDPFHCKILPGAGSREPGAWSREPGAANREQTTSERRARVKDELEMSQRQHFVPTQKSLPVGRLFSFFPSKFRIPDRRGKPAKKDWVIITIRVAGTGVTSQVTFVRIDSFSTFGARAKTASN
jgi:hypothetical protein